MNIVSVKHIPGQVDYLLKEGAKPVLKLRYKQELHTARIEAEKERRVLIIDDEGLLRTKLVFKNEYGIRIGQMTYDNFADDQGAIEIEQTRFRFSLHHTSVTELHIYKNSRRNLIYSCLLSFDDKTNNPTGADQGRVFFKAPLFSLIIAVCWYLFLKDTPVDSISNQAVIF